MKPAMLAAVVAGLAFPDLALAKEAPPMQFGSHPQEVLLAKITVSDLDKSIDFYTRVVGLKEVDLAGVAPPRDPAAAFEEVGLNYSGTRKDAQLVLVRRKGTTPRPESAELTWVAFKVPDVAAVIQRIRAEGLEIRSDAAAYGGITFGIARDPDGYVVELIQAPSFP
jgi:lactoylglutathione lyase